MFVKLSSVDGEIWAFSWLIRLMTGVCGAVYTIFHLARVETSIDILLLLYISSSCTSELDHVDLEHVVETCPMH